MEQNQSYERKLITFLVLFSACESGADIFAATHCLNPIPIVKYFDFDFHLSAEDAKCFFNGDHRSNLSLAQRELRLLHNKMSHIHIRRLQKLIHHEAPLDAPNTGGELSAPVVFRSRFAKTKSCSIPLCQWCALGKMQKVKTNTQEFTSVPEKEIALQREHLSPGDCVSGVYALWWWQSCSQSCFEEGLYAPSGFIEGIRHTRRQVILLVMKTNKTEKCPYRIVHTQGYPGIPYFCSSDRYLSSY